MAGNIKLIGAVGIKVRPDTSEFKKELREQIRELPDYDIEVKVDADTTIAKREMDRLRKKEQEDKLQLKVGIDFDGLQEEKKKVEAALKSIRDAKNTVTIPVKLDEQGLTRALAKLNRLQRSAKVEMKMSEDKQGYAAVLAKIRSIQREKIAQTITFKTDNKSLEREARKYEKLLAELDPKKTITITHQNDHESLTAAVKQIDDALASLKAVKITPEMNEEELLKAREKLQGKLNRTPLVMHVNDDKEGYQKVLDKVVALQRQAAETPISFKVDEQGLIRQAAKMRAKIKALTPPQKIELSYENDTHGLQKVLAEVNSKLKAMGEIKLTTNLDEEGLLAAKKDLEEKLANSSFSIRVDETNLSALKAERAKIEEAIADRNIKTTIDIENNLESYEEAKHQLNELIKKREAEIQAKALTFGAAFQLAYASRARVVPFYVKVNEKSLAIAAGLLKSLAGLNVLTESGRALEKMITKFDELSLKVGSVSTLVGSVTDTAAYAISSLFPLGEGILHLTGLLAFVPTAIAATTAAVLINVSAFKNFGSAIDGNAKALAKLPPEAQRTAKALQGAWTKIQEPVQKGFWQGMGSAMETAFNKFIPVVSAGLAKSAVHVGEFGAGMFRAFEKISLAGGPLEQMLNNLNKFFDNASRAAEPLFDAINRIGLRGSEFLPRFGDWLADIATRFDNWTKKADETGQITVWMEQAVQSLKDIWTLGGGVAKIFQAITSAVKDSGAGGLGAIADTFSRIGDMMKREPFQSRLSTIFDGARAGASKLNEGVKELGLTLGKSALFVGNMLDALGQLGGSTLKNISSTLGNLTFQDGILKGLTGMTTMVGDLRIGFYDLGSIIGNMSRVAGSAFASLSPVLNNIISLLDVVVGTLADNLVAVIPNLMSMINGVVGALAGPVQTIAEVLNGVLGFINALPGPLQQATLALLGLLLLGGKIGPMFAAKPGGLMEKIIYDFKNAETAGGKFKASMKGLGAGALSAVGGPWGLAIGAITTGLALAGQASVDAQNRIDAYTNAIDANTGALNANGLANAANNLLDKGGFWEDRNRGAKKTQDSIDILGLSFKKTAELAANGGPAYDDLMRKLDLFPGITGKGGMSMHGFADAMGITDNEASQLSKGDIVHLKQRLGEINSEAATGKDNFDHLSDSLNRVPADAAAQKLQDFNTAMGVYNDKTLTADQRTRALNTALDILSGRNASLEGAQLQVNDAMRAASGTTENLNGQMVKVGGVFRDASGNALNFNGVIDKTTGYIDTASTVGADLYRNLENVTGGVKTVATQMADAHEPIGKISEFLKKSRDDYIAQGVAAGQNADLVAAAYDYMIGANPGDLLTTITAQGVEDAETKVRNFKGTVDEIDGRKAVVSLLGDNVPLGVKLEESLGSLSAFDQVVATATADMDPARANAVRAQLMQDLLNLASQHPTVAADMDPKLLQREKDRVVADLKALAGMKPTPEVKAETEEAQRKLGQINTLIDNIKPKNVTIGVHTSYTQSGKPVDLTTIDRQMMYGGILNGAGVQKFANGGVVGPTVKRFATGGVERHVAQIARPSSVYRVWAEPETGGEAYIPLAASKRQRSTQILEQVAAQFGMTLSKTQTFSNGGVVSGGNSKATGLQVHIGTFNQNATDTVEDIGRGIMRQARNAGVSGILEGI